MYATHADFRPCDVPRCLIHTVVDRMRRQAVDSTWQVVVAFLLDLAGRWEMQPDTLATHMAFPSKVVSKVGEDVSRFSARRGSGVYICWVWQQGR